MTFLNPNCFDMNELVIGYQYRISEGLISVFVDSQSALFNLNRTNTANNGFPSQCKGRVYRLKTESHVVRFMWILIHVGICWKTLLMDWLTKQWIKTTQTVKSMNFGIIKGIIRNIRHGTLENTQKMYKRKRKYGASCYSTKRRM